MALGVSLGGIILGNYLVAKGEDARNKLVAVMLVSVAWDCFKGTESLEKWGLNLMLNRHLANCLISTVKDAKHHFEHLNFDSVFSSQTVKEFDQSFTVPQFGYKDVDHYYKEACLVGNVKHIKVPVLAINAHDDPFQVRNVMFNERMIVLVALSIYNIGLYQVFFIFSARGSTSNR